MQRASGVLLLVSTVLVATACGGIDGDDSSATRSGSRLRVEWLRTADGTQQFAGLWDSELEVRCYYDATSAPDADGASEQRCIPIGYTSTSYADADCTELVYELDAAAACAEPPAYVSELRQEPCQSHVLRVFRGGAPTTIDMIYYREGDGSCVGPSPAANTVYDVGEEVPVDSLVAGTAVTLGDGPLRRRAIEGDDGSRLPGQLWDVALASECYPRGEDDARCVPSTMYGNGYYSDDTCSDATVSYNTACDPTAARAPIHAELYIPAPDACDPGEVRYYTVGEEIAGDQLHAADELGACFAVEPSPDERFFALGEELGDSTFQAVDLRPSGANRLQPYEWTRDGLEGLSTGSYRDQELDLDCFPFGDTDGILRCVPGPDAYVRPRFSDDACTTPILLAEQYLGGCTPPAAPQLAWEIIQGACGQAQFHELGALFEEPTYRLIGEECIVDVLDPAQIRLYELGATIDMTRYQAFDLVTE